MSEILFLDDDENRWNFFKEHHPDADWVMTAKDCINALKTKKYDTVFLDHDLGGEVYVDSSREDTGMEVVRWLQKSEGIDSHFVVHTLNAYAGKRMTADLKRAGFGVTRAPFHTLF